MSNEMGILDPLRWLEGKWKGEGTGGFPTMDDFSFEDEMYFKTNAEGYTNEPIIHFEEVARVRENEELVFKHWETGYFKPAKNASIQFYNCHNTGRIEIIYGYFKSVDEQAKSFEIVFNSNDVRNDEGTAVMRSSQRIFTLKGDTLHYSLDMSTEDIEEMTHHLEVSLRRA